jgi:hypothetical protein
MAFVTWFTAITLAISSPTDFESVMRPSNLMDWAKENEVIKKNKKRYWFFIDWFY